MKNVYELDVYALSEELSIIEEEKAWLISNVSRSHN